VKKMSEELAGQGEGGELQQIGRSNAFKVVFARNGAIPFLKTNPNGNLLVQQTENLDKVVCNLFQQWQLFCALYLILLVKIRKS